MSNLMPFRLQNVQNDTGRLATSVAKERELSAHLVDQLATDISTFKNTTIQITAKTDPCVHGDPPFGASCSSLTDTFPMLLSSVNFTSKSMRRMHSKSPSLSCNRIRPISRKESSAPSNPPGRLLTSGNLACLLLSKILGVASGLIWPPFLLITSGFPFRPALITSLILIRHSGILRPSPTRAKRIPQ